MTVIVVFSFQLLIRNRSPWTAASAGTDCFFLVLKCLLIFLQGKQNGRLKEYAQNSSTTIVSALHQ